MGGLALFVPEAFYSQAQIALITFPAGLLAGGFPLPWRITVKEQTHGPQASTLRRVFRVLGRTLDALALLIHATWRVIRRSVTVILILGLLGTNIATLAIAPFQRLLSSGFEMVTGMTSVNKKLRTDASRSEARYVGEKARTTRLTKTVKVQEEVLGTARTELQASKRLVLQQGEALGKVARQSAEVGKITKRITERTVKSAALNFDSLIPQAVPVAGVAVIIGVTAMDLKWSCDTLKDMRALEMVFDPTIQQGEEETQVCGLRMPTKAEVVAKAGSMTKWVGDKGRGALDTAKDYIPSMPDVTLPSMPDFELPELRLPW